MPTKAINLEEVDKRTNEYKLAKEALDKKDASQIDKRSRASRILDALVQQQYGDAVKEFTDWIGIDQCGECKERQKRWNKEQEAKGNIDELTFKQDSILSDDAKLLLQIIWESHRTQGRVNSDLVREFGLLYRSIYGRKPECNSCNFIRKVTNMAAL